MEDIILKNKKITLPPIGMRIIKSAIGVFLGFVIYFGPMTFISTIMAEKNVKPYVTFPVKIVYINACLAALYYGSKTLFVDLSTLGIEINYAVIAIVGTIILLLLDTVMLMLYIRLKPIMDKAIKDTPKKKEKTEDDVFDFDNENASDSLNGAAIDTSESNERENDSDGGTHENVENSGSDVSDDDGKLN